MQKGHHDLEKTTVPNTHTLASHASYMSRANSAIHSMEGGGDDEPTAFSLTRPWALVFAADMAAGEGAAKVPKRREKRDVMVAVFGLRVCRVCMCSFNMR